MRFFSNYSIADSLCILLFVSPSHRPRLLHSGRMRGTMDGLTIKNSRSGSQAFHRHPRYSEALTFAVGDCYDRPQKFRHAFHRDEYEYHLSY